MPKIAKHHVLNFSTLTWAFKEGKVCLLDCRRKSDGSTVAMICALNIDEAGGVSFVPFAEMINGNPFDLYEPPIAGGDYGSVVEVDKTL